MSSDDVTRLETFLTRELDLTRAMLTQAREDAAHEAAAIRSEVGEVKARVDAIASRLERVEDTHAEERAHEQGRHQVHQLLGRLAVNVVSIAVALIGAWYVVADHVK